MRLILKVIAGIIVIAGITSLLIWTFKTKETAAYVNEVSWAHHVQLLEDYTETECGMETDFSGEMSFQCHEETYTRELQHEVHQGTNGLEKTTWPTVSAPKGRQYVKNEARYVVKFHREKERWTYNTNNLGYAKKFKPGKLWLIKVNRLSMVWPIQETGVEN